MGGVVVKVRGGWRCGVVGALAVVVLPSAARAQSSGSFLLDTISIYATRNERQLLDIPATVTVVGREEIERRMVRDAEDLVRYEPGVRVDRTTSRTDPFSNLSGFTIRGVSGNRVLTLIDGTRVIERITDGTRDFVDMSNLKAVEIIRGPGSVLWGSDALGGIVAYQTKDPDDYLKGTGKLYGGQMDTSYDTFDGSWVKSITGAWQSDQRGTWQGLINASRRDAHEPKLRKARADGGVYGCPRNPEAIRCNELDPFDLVSENVLGKLIWRPTNEHEFKLTGEWFKRDTDVDQKYDLGFVNATTRQLSYQRHQVLSRQRGTFSHDWRPGVPFLDSVRWQITHSPQEREFTGERLRSIASGAQQQRFDFLLKYGEVFSEFDSQFNSTIHLGPSVHRLTYGAYGNLTDTDYARRDITTNLTTGTVTVTNAGGFNFANATTTRKDVFLQDEIELWSGKLRITPGLRYSNYKIDPRPDQFYIAVPGKEPREIEEGSLTKQVGTVFKVDDIYSLFGRYAEGFKMPTAQQLYTSLPLFDGTNSIIPNPDLKPESVKSYEAGLRGRFQRGFFSVSVFYADYTNFIQSLAPVPNSGNVTNINLSKVQLKGVEAFAEYQLHENWFANLSMTYQYGDQMASPGADWTPFNGASPLTTVAGLRYVNPGLNLTGEFVGTFSTEVSRVTPFNHFKPDGYAVFDTIWSWKPHRDITLRAAIYNVTDQRYFKWPMGLTYAVPPSPASVAVSNPLELQTQPGRTFKFGANVVF